MKVYSYCLLAAITLSSCVFPSSTKTKDQNKKEIEGDWILSGRSVYNHIYRADGLLEKTFETNYTFMKGHLALISEKIVVKSYDNKNNLVGEVRFSNDTTQLPEKTIWKYDSNNNLLSMIQKSDGSLERSEENHYSQKNQVIKKIIIERTFREIENLDSALAKKYLPPPLYDTVIYNYSYDKSGQLIDTNYDPEYRSDSIKVGDTMITFTKTSEFTDTVWQLDGQIIKGISHNLKTHQKSLDILRYDEKGNVIEELHYKNSAFYQKK
jgi:hypothetical protein